MRESFTLSAGAIDATVKAMAKFNKTTPSDFSRAMVPLDEDTHLELWGKLKRFLGYYRPKEPPAEQQGFFGLSDSEVQVSDDDSRSQADL